MILEQSAGLIDNEFIGRNEILEEINKQIDEGASAIVIKGPGGSGKTALLRRIAALMKRKQYAFIDCDGQIIPEILLEQIFQKAKKKGVEEAAKIYYDIRLPLREKILWFTQHYLLEEKVLILFDDFHANLDNQGKFKNERLKEFIVYLKESLNEKDSLMVFSTGSDIPGFESIWLTPLEEVEFRKFLAQRKALNRMSRKSVEKMLFDIGGSPRTLRLLDHIAVVEYGDKKFEWEPLKKKIPNLAERILHKESETADFSPILMEYLWEHLDETGVEVLSRMSIFPHPIKKEVIEKPGVTISNKTIKQLTGYSLLEYDSKGDWFGIHPLTARFVHGKVNDARGRDLHLETARYYEKLENNEGVTRDFQKDLQARHHYREAEEWEKVMDMSFELDEYLASHGNPQLGFDLLEELIPQAGQFASDRQLNFYRRLSIYYSLFGKLDALISNNETLIKLYEETGEQQGIAFCYRQSGAAYESKQKLEEALENYRKSLEIYLDLDDNKACASIRVEIGKIAQRKGDYDEAFDQYRQAIELYNRLEDQKSTSDTLQRMAKAHEECDRFEEALKYYHQALEIKEKIGDEKDIAACLHEIGNVYFLKNHFEPALEYYKRALELNEKADNLEGAGYSLGQIGLIYQRTGRLNDALEQYQQALEIFEKLDDPRGKGSSLHQLGRIYQDLGDRDKALEYLNKSIQLREEHTDMPGMALGYGQLGILHLEREEYEESLRASVKAFVLFNRMNAPAVQLVRKNILRVKEHLPEEKFREILDEFNIKFDAST